MVMSGKMELKYLVKEMKPKLNKGDYVFVVVSDLSTIDRAQTLCEFKEAEGVTIVIEKQIADKLNLKYDFVASWITLTVHSSLEAVGLTAVFSSELTKNNISSNVIAGFYHDHIFVAKEDSNKAIEVLNELSKNHVE
ncbi:ACT domain-containing protein [Tamlana flava]|uniref:ACT domain-containing protein n=1 Tax=Tamlana flava TaxID=3158572 RepID=UPI00351B0EBC